MEKSEEYKQCPECTKDIKIEASFCSYCGKNVSKVNDTEDGKFIRVKIKAHNKIYHGDIYVFGINGRASDRLNDDRKFLPLVNATEEGKLDELELGYITLNKSVIESVSEIEDNSKEEEQPIYSYTTNRDI
jgi:hypothetical protein